MSWIPLGQNCEGSLSYDSLEKVGKLENFHCVGKSKFVISLPQHTQFSKVPSAFRLSFGTNSVGAGCPGLQRWQGHSLITDQKEVPTGQANNCMNINRSPLCLLRSLRCRIKFNAMFTNCWTLTFRPLAPHTQLLQRS